MAVLGGWRVHDVEFVEHSGVDSLEQPLLGLGGGVTGPEENPPVCWRAVHTATAHSMEQGQVLHTQEQNRSVCVRTCVRVCVTV